MTDAAVELWQADPPADEHFPGFGRCRTDQRGEFRFKTVKPGPVPGRGNAQQAPHFAIALHARGLLKALMTRAYFVGDPLNETDPLLSSIEDARAPRHPARPAREREPLEARHPAATRPARRNRNRVPRYLNGGGRAHGTFRFPRSIATVSLAGTLPEKLEAAASVGFNGVELFENDLLTFDGTPAEVRRICRELGLTITAFQPFRDFEAMPEPERARNLERAERKFDVMQALGTDLMLVCSNVHPAAIDDTARAAADLRTLAERAARRGLRIAYEALAWGRHVRRWSQAWEIVQLADHPALGLVLDSFHTLALRDDFAGIADFPPKSSFCPARRRAFDVDMDLLSWSRHFRNFPGQGDLDVVGFLRAVLASAIAARSRSRSSTTNSAPLRHAYCARRIAVANPGGGGSRRGASFPTRRCSTVWSLSSSRSTRPPGRISPSFSDISVSGAPEGIARRRSICFGRDGSIYC